MSDLVFDFPDGTDGGINFKDDEKAVLVVDADFNVYKPQREHDGLVFVQKCLVRKGQYERTSFTTTDEEGKQKLTQHPTKVGAFLVKETNFQDIGGGLQTFERHYATFPSPWYEFEEVSYQTSHYGIINYRDKAGEGADWSKSRDVLARANYFYFRRDDIPDTRVPDTQTAGTAYIDDYTINPLNGSIVRFNTYYNIAPQSYLGRNWEDYGTPESSQVITAVVAPDRINPYMGEIYEFVRYTIEF